MRKFKLFLLMMTMFFVSVYGVNAATLVDYEDFESFNNLSDILADSHWYCPNPPNCDSETGSATASIVIGTDAGNNYLSMFSTGFVPGVDTATNQLIRNQTLFNASAGFIQYTMQFDMRGYAWYNASWGNQMRNVYTEMEEYHSDGAIYAGFNPIYGAGFQNSHVLGGYYNLGVPTQAQWELLRLYGVGGVSPYSNPPSINCNWTDLNWHQVTKIYTYNNSNFINTKEYIDDTLCYDYNSSVAVGSYVPFAQIWFGTGNEALLQIDNLAFYEGEQLPSVEQCQDGTDNDGDGFVDYPDDPSCNSATDDTESPYDYVACNNGIDDDADGYIDYPDDPSCANDTDTTESPRDASPAAEDSCLIEEGCLLRDTFPYSDELNLHGWYGELGSLWIPSVFGSYALYFDTDSDTQRFNVSKNISNPNIYDSVNVEGEFFIDIADVGILTDDTNYTFYWELLDSSSRKVSSLRFDVSRVSPGTNDFVKVILYNHNGTDYVQVGNTINPGHGSSSRIQFFLSYDQILKTYDMEYIEEGESIVFVNDIPWSDVMATKIYTMRFQDVNSIDDSKVEVYADNFDIYTDDIDYDSVCDEWDLPYYLVESFNGYPQACDWSSNLNIFFTGKYKVYDTTPLYQQQKQFPYQVLSTRTRYATVKWDAEFDSIAADGSTQVRLYDDEGYNFFTVYWLGTTINYYYNDDGSGVVARSSIPLNQTYEYMVVLDMQDDTADIYFNGSKVVSDGGLADDFYNLNIIEYLKLTSASSSVELDNLEIYASTEDGTKFIGDDEITPVIVNDTTMCGLLFLDQPSCIRDSDCESGKCLVNNVCSRLDANYCEEKGMKYGNACYLGGMAECTLDTAGNIIVDNFFLFLVFLVILMLVVYFVIMNRGG